MTALPFGVADDEELEGRALSQRLRDSGRKRSAPFPSRERHFLFLRGPFGRFFSKVADELKVRGHRISKIVFDGGDLSDWGFLNPHLTYRDPEDAWPLWIDRYFTDEKVTDLILLNDCIEVHTAAIAAARRRGVRVHVFEEGYFRPRWITLEEDGVNAYSPCPRDPDYYRTHGEPLVKASVGDADVGRPTAWLILKATWHYVCKVFGQWAYPSRPNPFVLPVYEQIVGSIIRYFKNRLAKRAVTRKVDQLIASPQPFFIALMQRAGDSQLWRHSSYTNDTFAADVIENFARHAPADARLVFKLHPLDPGMVNYGKMIRDLAEQNQVTERIIFLDGGNLNMLSHKARGAVTINSTAGLATIGFGCPTKVLGRAVYDIAGMTDRQPLSRFWRSPQAPDHELFLKFRNVMMEKTQINGAYYTPKGIRLAVGRAVDKLCG